MTDEPVTLWRCAWKDGNQERQRDHDNEDAAERFARWMGRKSPPITVLVYAVRVWLNEEAS